MLELLFTTVHLPLFGALVVVCLTILMLNYFEKKSNSRWKIAKKRESSLNKANHLKSILGFNNLSKILKDEMFKITELSSKLLLEKLQNGELSAKEVLKAYQVKALEVTDKFNCVTEFITEAQSWAEELDKHASSGSKKGPLHGLPFSVKDNIAIKGYDSTAGLSKFVNDPCSEDAVLVAALKSLGAIPFCKTNVPQTLLSFACSNPIWGSTCNPWSVDRTPGGSSGGEACLIAAGGSIFGVCSDIGGSARIPAAFCGIPSIKVTSFRLSYKGVRKSAVGCVGIHAVPGLLARDAETLALISKLLLDNSYLAHFDPEVLPIPWNELMFNSSKKLRVGCYDTADYFPTTPGVKRAIKLAKLRLKNLGHELVEFTPQSLDYVLNTVLSMFYADRGKYVLHSLGHDDLDAIIKVQIKYGLRMPHFIKTLLRPIVSKIAPRLVPCAMAIDGYQFRHTYQLWKGIANQSEYKSNFLNKWRELGLDLCIGPCFACPAPLSKDAPKLSPACSYASLYNFLDLPAGIALVTRETEEDQARLEEECNESDLVVKLMKKSTRGALGLPLSVQVIGLPYQEETVLRGIQILQESLY